MKPMPVNVDLGLLLARLMLGVVGVYHGSGKLFGSFGGKGLDAFAGSLAKMDVPMPKVAAILAGSAECFGGGLIAIGLFPRLAAIPFVFTMMVAFFKGHKGVFPAQNGGGEYALTLGVFAAAIVIAGPGKYALGSVVSRRSGGSKSPSSVSKRPI